MLIAIGASLTALGCVEKLQQPEGIILDNYPNLFEKDAMVIVGENETQIELEGAKAIAYNLGELTGNVPVIKTDAEITEKEKAGYNLILVGRSDTNKMLKDVYKRTNATGVTDEYPGTGKGILEILRNPWNESKMMLLVEGSDEWGVRAGSVVLEEKQKVKGETKAVTDWEETTGVKFPLDNAEEAIRYAKIEASVKKWIRMYSDINNIEENAKKPITIKNPAIDIFCVKTVIGNIEKTAVVINIKVIKSTIRSTTREETAPEKIIFCFLEIPYARSSSPILRGKMLFPIYPTMVTLYRSLVEALPTLLIKICHLIARIQTLNTSRAIAAIRTK